MIFEQQMDLLKKDNKPEWTRPNFPDVTGIKQVAVDLETHDPEIKNLGGGWATNKGFVVGVAISFEGFDGYFPVRHERGGNFSEEDVKNWLKKLFKQDPIVICHNAVYDLGWLRRWGVECNVTKVYDTLIAAPLVDENRFSYSLDNLSKDYLGERKQGNILEDFGKEHGFKAIENMHLVPVEYAGIYAEQDTRLTLKLWEFLRVEIQRQGLTDVFNLETDLLRLLLEMRWKGVRVDLEKAEKTKKFFKSEEEKIYQNIKKETGIDIGSSDIYAAASLQKIFDKLGEKYELTEKNKQAKISNTLMKESQNPLIQSISIAREYNKAHTTFIDSILKHQVDGRIHAEINQLKGEYGGTVSGRLSMNNPNLQQVPARNEAIGPKIRSLFLPEEGHKWASLDYSQQEPRLLVHYAKKHGLEGAETLIKFFHEGKDFHQVTADMAQISRKEAKTIGLGLMYGMGIAKLADSLDISPDEAKALKKKYNDNVQFLNNIIVRATRYTEQHGYINTLLGRRCRFELYESKDFHDKRMMSYENAKKVWAWNEMKRAGTYRALNRLIQGSAADQTKKAMVDLWKNVGVVPMIQIHDELNVSIANETQVKEIKEIMESAVELHVPVKCDAEIGDNWGEIK
jgi:DNA polymerase I-like protein with 3'-5' exonuclease and polymerase domains